MQLTFPFKHQPPPQREHKTKPMKLLPMKVGVGDDALPLSALSVKEILSPTAIQTLALL